MKITDPIGDMITRIRNGQMRGLKKVSVPGSKLRKAVLDVLQKEGFIQEYTVSKDKSFETIEINLKYMYGGPYRDWETDRKSTRLNSSHRL